MTDGRPNPRHYKYYDLVMAGFVTVLLCSNIIGPGKVCQIWGFSFGAGNLFFPISYIFGDILTEVYGYARARSKDWFAKRGRPERRCSGFSTRTTKS